MPPASRRLGEILVERKVLSRDELENLLDRETAEGVQLPRLLLAESKVSEKDLVAALGERAGFGFVDLERRVPNPMVETMVPPAMVHSLLALPVDLEGDSVLVAMADPSNKDALAQLEDVVGLPIRPAIAVRSELLRAIASIHGAASNDSRLLESLDDQLHLNTLLQRVVELGGSDLHLTVGIHPRVRINGQMADMAEFPIMNGSEVRRMIFAVLTQKQRERFEEELELDTSHSVPKLGRFRVNVFIQRDSVGAVLRVIPYEIVPLEKLGMPSVVAGFADLPRGLVLVTGPTGSGKSTTLATLIDTINTSRAGHIMTVEDPIEFLHKHKRSVVNQREVGQDTHSFSSALRHVLRQDPDVILVGEMRDLETISTAITAAETGHLVFGTLHTQDAPQSVDRIIDVFPAHQQSQIRVQLASAIQGIVTQQLIPRANGQGRVAAAEVLVATPAIRNLIREGKTHQIYSAMQAGGKYGMITMDMSLAGLVRSGEITMAAAVERCAHEDALRRISGDD
jgi:twitching motility protein PilT